MWLLLPCLAPAAEVPAGTKLAAKQEIVIGNGAEPGSLDPHKTQGIPEQNLQHALFEGLVSYDANGKPVPGVAEHWETREGGKVWLFTLRREARWSDGSPLTAEDFEYAFKRVIDPKTASVWAWFLGSIANIRNAEDILAGKKLVAELGVKALSATQLQIVLEQPIVYFLKVAGHVSMFPLPRRQIEKFGDKWTDPDKLVGNGAFRLVERVVNERIVFARNPHYWDNAKTVIDRASYLPIGNPTAEYQRYRANDIDLTSDGGVPSEQMAAIRKELNGELLSWPQTATYGYMFNTRRPPFDDIRVRRALALAINRDVIVGQVLQGGQAAAWSMTPRITEGYRHAPSHWEQATQLEREAEARRLLASAGFGPGSPLKIPLLYNSNDQHKKLALAVAAMWKRIGPVEVELQNQEWKTFLETRQRGDFSVARFGWTGYDDPANMLAIFHSASAANNGKYQNPRFDDLLERARIQPGPETRVQLYQEAERLLAEETPSTFVYHYVNLRLVKPWIKGYGRNPDGTIRLKDLYRVAR